MVSCIACGMSHTARKYGISLHKFPKNPQQRELWRKFVNKREEDIPRVPVLCSQHFEENDFEFGGAFKILLKKTAVPSRIVQRFKYDRVETFTKPPSNMSKKCLVWTCKNKGDVPGITFHSLKKHRYVSWLKAIGRSPRENIFPANVICSKHFRPDDFHYIGDKLDVKPHVVPTQYLPRNAVLFHAKLREVGQSAECCNVPTAEEVSQTALELMEVDENFPNHGRIEIQNMEIIENGTEKQNIVYFSNDSLNVEINKRLAEDFKQQLERRRLLRNKTRLERQRYRRINGRLSLLQDVVNGLRDMRMLSDDAYALLEKTFVDRLVVRDNKKQYCTLRSFAMTLQFFSSKAYEYARTNFNLRLPSLRHIRSRISSVSCNPGFSKPVFQSLKGKVRADNGMGRATLCNLTLDEMPLKKQIEYRNGKTWGYVDLNTGLKEDDTLPLATKALVLMVVSLNGQWKLPIAYFLVHCLTPDEKANVVKEALIKLHSCGIVVTSVTCDGPIANFNMMQQLGGQFDDVSEIVPYFAHPVDKSKVFIIFDACRTVKNLKNAWKVLQKFVDPGGSEVDFEYLERLKDVREEQEMMAKLKVNVDVETLSECVATALEILKDKIRDRKFKGASATIDFVHLVAKVSNVLSSKSPFTMGTKMPIEKDNEEKWMPILQKAVSYFSNCRTVENRLLTSTDKQASFKGLIFTISSVIGIYETYVKPEDAKLKSLLTHKLSQDHLEQFFNSIRLTSGCNNNPSAWQFRNLYKRLLSYDDIKAVNSNGTAQSGKKTW